MTSFLYFNANIRNYSMTVYLIDIGVWTIIKNKSEIAVVQKFKMDFVCYKF